MNHISESWVVVILLFNLLIGITLVVSFSAFRQLFTEIDVLHAEIRNQRLILRRVNLHLSKAFLLAGDGVSGMAFDKIDKELEQLDNSDPSNRRPKVKVFKGISHKASNGKCSLN